MIVLKSYFLSTFFYALSVRRSIDIPDLKKKNKTGIKSDKTRTGSGDLVIEEDV